MQTVHIIGAGLAGTEAAWQLAQRGVFVRLTEMKPQKFSPAHKSPLFAELVCSNSLRADDYLHNAVGLMHEEMRRAGSLVMAAADALKVPAGAALAVDREGFSRYITDKISDEPLIKVESAEQEDLPVQEDELCIVASGPLTSEKLAKSILEKVENNALSFYDAISPVVYKESIDFEKAW